LRLYSNNISKSSLRMTSVAKNLVLQSEITDLFDMTINTKIPCCGRRQCNRVLTAVSDKHRCKFVTEFRDVIFPPFRGNPPISSILEKIKSSGFDLK
jgi:hypothetical protein